MTDQALAALINRLREEIDNLPPSDHDARDRLEGIAGDLEKRIENAGDDEHHAGLVGSIQDTVHDLETRHPDATTVLNNIMMALANIGI